MSDFVDEEFELERALRQLVFAATLEDSSAPAWASEPLRGLVWDLAERLAVGPTDCHFHIQNMRVVILHAAADLRMTLPAARVHSQPGRVRVAWALERAAEILAGICGDVWLPHDPHCPFCEDTWNDCSTRPEAASTSPNR